MSINDNMLGEYFYISNSLSVLVMYKNKEVIDSKKIKDFKTTITTLCTKTNCLNTDSAKYILNNIDLIDEVIITSKGVDRFSLK